MKIQAVKSQKNKSDTLELNGNELTINNTIFDLTNLHQYPTEKNADIQTFIETERCYKDQNGIDIIQLKVDQQHFFLFVNNNYLLFHDKDLNGELDLSELCCFVDCYNLSEEDRLKNHRKTIDKYEKKSGKKIGDWNILARTVTADKTKIKDK